MPTLKVAIDASKSKEGAKVYESAANSIKSSSGVATKSVDAVSKSFRNLLALAGATLSMKYIIGVALEQEKSYTRLAAALDLVGDKTENNMRILTNHASELQKVTIYGDEELMNQTAYLKNLGIHTTLLNKTTDAAVGLAAKYRVDLSTAAMLLGRASLGQTTMLTRYGIILEDSLGPQEKFNAVLKLGADAMEIAYNEATTGSGILKQLKNIIGDTAETIGEMFLPSILKSASALRDWLTNSRTDFSRWAAKATATIDLVSGSFFDIVTYITSDLPENFSVGLDAALIILEAWGRSVYTILEKVFSDIAANMGIWIKRAFSDKSQRETMEKSFYELLYENAYPQAFGLLANQVKDPKIIAGLRKQAKELADQQFKAFEELGVLKSDSIPDASTSGWKSTMEKIAAINAEAVNKAKNVFPEDITVKLAERKAKFLEALGLADTRFPTMNKRVENAIADINRMYPKDLSLGTDERRRTLTSGTPYEIKPDTEKLDKMSEDLDFKLQILGKTNDERDRAIQKRQIETIAIDELGLGAKEAEAWADRLDKKLVDLQGASKLVAIADGVGEAFGSAFEDAVIGAKSLSDAIKSLIQDVAKLIIRQTVTAPLAAGISGGLQSMFGVGTGAPAAHSLGGVIGSRAMFAMADGRMGMAGENGSEGIFPLKRSRDGKLGVIASGSGGAGGVVVQNSIQIVNNTSKGVDATVGSTQFDGQKYVTSIILKDMSSNGPITQALGRKK